MYHRKPSRLNRASEKRKLTLINLAKALFSHGKIITTLAKAKELKRYAERLISKAKEQNLSTRRYIASHLNDKVVVRRVCDTIAPRFKERKGGYIRVIKLGNRVGDGAEMAVIELVE
jgi:large subunit ribosomal protein L17